MLFDAPEKIAVKGQVVLRQNATYNMNLCNRLVIIFFNNIKHVLQAVFPTLMPLLDEP